MHLRERPLQDQVVPSTSHRAPWLSGETWSASTCGVGGVGVSSAGSESDYASRGLGEGKFGRACLSWSGPYCTGTPLPNANRYGERVGLVGQGSIYLPKGFLIPICETSSNRV